MTYASGATSGLFYVAETVFGTTPATPQMIEIPMSSTTLDLTKDTITDPTIISDRLERDVKHGNRRAGGNIVATAKHGQFDDFIEAALGGTWTADVVKASSTTGGTPRSFTIEQKFGDISQYRVFTGQRVNTMEISAALNSYVNMTFGMIGKGMSTSSTALDSTVTPALNKAGMTMTNGTITVGGTATCLTQFTLTHNNNMTDLFCLTSDSAREVNWAKAMTDGTMTLYFSDLTDYNRFLNETTAAVVVTFTDGTDTYTITMPKVKFNTATLPVPNPDVLFLTLGFKALYDATLGSTFSITRT